MIRLLQQQEENKNASLPGSLLHFLMNSKPLFFFLLILGIIVGLLFNRRVGILTFFVSYALLFIYFHFIVQRYTFNFSCICGEMITKHVIFLPPKTMESFSEDSEGHIIKECPSCKRNITKQWKEKGGESLLKNAVTDKIMLLPDSEKEMMSEFITKIVDPLLNRKPHMYKQLFAAAISVWNLSLQPEERQLMEKKRVIDRLKKEKYGTKKECKDVVNKLLLRKEKYYSDNKRAILDYRLRLLKSGEIHLVIKSEPPSEINRVPIDSQ